MVAWDLNTGCRSRRLDRKVAIPGGTAWAIAAGSIRGSLTSPQFDTQFLRDLGRQAVSQADEGMLQQAALEGFEQAVPGWRTATWGVGTAPAQVAPSARRRFAWGALACLNWACRTWVAAVWFT